MSQLLSVIWIGQINKNTRMIIFIVSPFEYFQTRVSSRGAMAIARFFLLRFIDYKCSNLTLYGIFVLMMLWRRVMHTSKWGSLMVQSQPVK